MSRTNTPVLLGDLGAAEFVVLTQGAQASILT